MNSDLLQKELRKRWEKYLTTADYRELVALLVEFPELTKQECVHEYPSVHRIKDLFIGRYFRVCRCCFCNERLMFLPCNQETFSEEDGVPYGLKGEQLLKWVRDETCKPAKGMQDWSKYS